MNHRIITRSHVLLGFADDIVGVDHQAVVDAFVLFKRKAARIGLPINTSKTIYMIADRQHGSNGDVGREVV